MQEALVWNQFRFIPLVQNHFRFIALGTNSSSALWFMNEVAVHWHSEVLQACWFPHNGAMSGQKEGIDLRPISPWDGKFPFSILCTVLPGVWWPSSCPERSTAIIWTTPTREAGMILLLHYKEYYVIWQNPSTGVINSCGEIRNCDLLITVAANNPRLKMWCTKGNSSLSKPLQILDSETIKIVCVSLGHRDQIMLDFPSISGFCPHTSSIPKQPVMKTS